MITTIDFCAFLMWSGDEWSVVKGCIDLYVYMITTTDLYAFLMRGGDVVALPWVVDESSPHAMLMLRWIGAMVNYIHVI